MPLQLACVDSVQTSAMLASHAAQIRLSLRRPPGARRGRRGPAMLLLVGVDQARPGPPASVDRTMRACDGAAPGIPHSRLVTLRSRR